jgi:hypothetical protein
VIGISAAGAWWLKSVAAEEARMKADQVWADLLKAGLVQGASPELNVRSPWFVRVMLGVAGWFGALFLLFFVGLAMSFIFKNAGAALLLGAGACAVAAMLFRKFPEHDFAGSSRSR